MAILDLLADQGDLGLSEIARQLNQPKGTVHRFLVSLLNYGYVRQAEHTRRYALGYRFVAMANSLISRMEIVKLAEPYLVRLLTLVGETVNLAVLDGLECLYLRTLEAPQSIRMVAQSGSRDPLHCTALGKAILAYMPERFVQQVIAVQGLRRRTPGTLVTPEALRQDLERTRERGYAVDDVENEENVRCIGAPILGHADQVLGAISVSGPAFRLTPARDAEIGPMVRDIARELSSRAQGLPEEARDGRRVAKWEVARK